MVLVECFIDKELWKHANAEFARADAAEAHAEGGGLAAGAAAPSPRHAQSSFEPYSAAQLRSATAPTGSPLPGSASTFLLSSPRASPGLDQPSFELYSAAQLHSATAPAGVPGASGSQLHLITVTSLVEMKEAPLVPGSWADIQRRRMERPTFRLPQVMKLRQQSEQQQEALAEGQATEVILRDVAPASLQEFSSFDV